MIVRVFRDLRGGTGQQGDVEPLSTIMSTAEAVSVAYAVGARGWFLRGEAPTPRDVLDGLLGAAIKDDREDVRRIRTYMTQRVSKLTGAHWREFYESRSLLDP